ncbi:MAG: hypothetical protein WD267_05665 [Balneolales bacterium]
MNLKKGIRSEAYFSWEEREAIIKEYQTGDLSKSEIWEKYTGQRMERGRLLRWMRKLGYIPEKKTERRKSFFYDQQPTSSALDKKEPYKTPEELQSKIKELEKQLEMSRIKAEGYELMIKIAENELNIPIRKKHDTK